MEGAFMREASAAGPLSKEYQEYAWPMLFINSEENREIMLFFRECVVIGTGFYK
jgi:hypothetical protein